MTAGTREVEAGLVALSLENIGEQLEGLLIAFAVGGFRRASTDGSPQAATQSTEQSATNFLRADRLVPCRLLETGALSDRRTKIRQDVV